MIDPDGAAVGGTALFRVGSRVADPDRNLILRDGELIRVEPKVMEALAYLARSGGRIVSREELRREVWRAHVVDEAVQRVISGLRTALGAPDAIETVPRKGYRLVEAAGPIGAPAMRGEPGRDRRRLVLAAAFLAGVMAGAAAVALWPAPIAEAPPAPPASRTAAPAAAPSPPS